jgi:hypothetical protein
MTLGLFVAPTTQVLWGQTTIELNPLDRQTITRWSGVNVLPGIHGPMLGLDDARKPFNNGIDLVVHFNGGDEGIYAGNYQLMSWDGIVQNQIRASGPGSGLFTQQSNGLVLQPLSGSMFLPGTIVGGFTIEFWLYSAAPREGGTVLSWLGSTWSNNQPMFQNLTVSLVNRRIVWDLENFFVRGQIDQRNPRLEGLQVQLTQRRDLIPRRWTHHMLRYSPERNLLEYLVDGVTESLVYVTSNGREFGDSYIPFVGELSDRAITIGENLNGIIDEFALSRFWVEEPLGRGVSQDPGYAIFQRRDLSFPGARIQRLEIEGQTPGLTEARLWWFLSDLIESPLREDPRWNHSEDRVALESERGRYLYVKAEFLPDGTIDNRPGISTIRVTYLEQLPPPAPSRVRVVPVSGGVELFWDQVIRGNPEGYVVYFGTRPNEYFGHSIDLGSSPILVGNTNHIKITGLEPGRVYYFRVGTYNYSNNPIRGQHIPISFSDEVATRPNR